MIESLPLSVQKINFTSLSVLDLSYNFFNTSSFPSWLFNLTSLRKLDLGKSSFGGPFPDELASLKSLEYLDLSDLDLKGRIARVIGNMCKLKFLSLGNTFDDFGNKFYGEKIEEIWSSWSNCPNNTMALESLDFSDCGLEGQLPASLGMLTSLQHLHLSSLLLWGSIPESIGNLSKVWAI
ncbi:probable inactive leucine-rich repeat receptor kinase XIAO [Prunus avium]|uniref:Probable inactive leucine-rich repeat receptor kinase XIAO n=1 Tax=Prunus avium TaxID=42229 RepID=A0A6P5RDN5_PRUAV|nr:probable inactive leucine-rich repeat receptor kinase XIAO [Prunus avium]